MTVEPGWWLLECGHYGSAPADLYSTRNDRLICRTCTSPRSTTIVKRMVVRMRGYEITEF